MAMIFEQTSVAVVAAPVDQLGARKEAPTAIRNLTEYAKRSMAPPFSDHTPAGPTEVASLKSTETTSTALRPEQQPILPRPLPRLEPLSFAPSVRLKEDDGRAAQTDRETMPSINIVAEVAARLGLAERNEPLATPAHGAVPQPPAAKAPGSFSDLPLVRGSLEGATSGPWSATETTVPAGVGLEAGKILPLVITAPDLPPLPESAAAPSPRKKLVSAVTGPLPAALKNKPLPVGQDTTGGRTTSSRSGFVWVVIPLVAVLGVAAFIGYTLWQEQLQTQLEEAEARRTRLGTPSNQDTRSREVDAPAPLEAPEPEALLDAGMNDDELSDLTAPPPVEPAVVAPPEKPPQKPPEPPPPRPKKKGKR
jgi:hypothetical protein